MPTFKVFVSSTYIDLKDHRRAVIDNLLRLKLQPVAMEFFGAEPAEPKQVCDNEIEDCDLFVGIYAHRYGFVPEESEKSITEQEFDLARELGKPSFCYLIDEEHPWPPKFIEDEPGKSRLRAFKARIESALVRDTFTTPQDLAGRVSSNLGKWLLEHGTSIPSTPKVYHNLPQPDYGTFIGREAELAQVHRTLRPYPHSQEHLVTIDGIGGIGKSALALEVAHRYLRDYDRLPPEERFDAIIWTSAKAEVLIANGIAPRQQITRTLDDIYTTIAVTLEREGITRARPEEQDELVTKALTQQRTLLIVDNLETVDDERVNAFLRELPAPTKAIVTTRHRIDVAYPVRLTGMPKEDGLALIAQECVKKSVTLTDAEAGKLYDRTGSVPLAIVWSVAQMGYGHGSEAVLHRLGQPTSDIARFCFEGAMEQIRGKPVHKLLMALSLFATDASREALGYVAGLPDLDRDEGLVTLERLSLVNKSADRFAMLPLTKQYARAELFENRKLEKDLRTRWSEYLGRLLARLRERSFESLQEFALERGNLLEGLDWLWAESRYDDFVDSANQIEFFLWVTGQWGAWQEILDKALKIGLLQEDVEIQAIFCYRLSNLSLFRGNLQQATAFARRAEGLFKAQYDERNYAKSLIRTGWALARYGDLSAAERKLQEALQIFSRVGNDRYIPRVHRGLALVDIERKEFEAARQHLQIARALREKEDTLSAGLAVTYRMLGEVDLMEDDLTKAREHLRQSLSLAQQLEVQQDIAEAKLGLARVEEKAGNVYEASHLAEEALEIFNRLGMKEYIAKTADLLQKIEVGH